MSAPALALAYGIGRIGCFLAGDATWGKISDVPCAMAFPNAIAGWADPLTGIPYPPRYESSSGTIFGLYLSLAELMRFVVEIWRVNLSSRVWDDRVSKDQLNPSLLFPSHPNSAAEKLG
jgi:phosphatidylglycerol---prolipoprotein diacylglyceryl transferase